jgi:hypothetical protein
MFGMALLDSYRVRVEQIDPATYAAWVYCPGCSVPDIFFTDTVKAGLITQVQDFVQVVIIGVGTAVAVITTDVTEEHTVGRTIYGMTALLWVVVPSVWAWLPKWGRDIPFLTFFGTVQSLDAAFPLRLLSLRPGWRSC